MDVRCEQCKTLYELDDARVSEAGTTVRCTTCGHVFRVRKKVLLMTEAVGAGGESTAVPPPIVDKPPWRVRSPSGRVIAFRELTSMQKWIVERKFGRDDEISLHGDSWKRLGEIAELQPFFLLLDEVDRVHQLEERLRRAELPDEGASLLEEELAAASPPPPESPRPAPTPIRLERPIEPPPAEAEPDGSGPVPTPAPLAPDSDGGGRRTPTSPGLRAEAPRPGAPAAFSLDEIREATRPSPDDPAMPEGPVEPQAPDEADQPEFTRRAGLGIDPGVVDDADGWGAPTHRASKGPWVAAVLIVAALGGIVGAYFQVWVPAQEAKLRQEAERARLEQEEKSRAAQEAEVRERERRAKEELLAGMAGRADAGPSGPLGEGRSSGTVAPAGTATPTGTTADAGTGGSAPPEPGHGSTDPVKLSPPAPARNVAAVTPTRGPRPAPVPPRTFEEWMAQGDRDREHARARAALDAYDHAIALDGSRAEAYLGQGRAMLDLGDARSAIAAFRRALMVNSRYSVAEFWLGEAYRRAGQTSEAVGAYGRYLEEAPEGAEAARARQALNTLR